LRKPPLARAVLGINGLLPTFHIQIGFASLEHLIRHLWLILAAAIITGTAFSFSFGKLPSLTKKRQSTLRL